MSYELGDLEDQKPVPREAKEIASPVILHGREQVKPDRDFRPLIIPVGKEPQLREPTEAELRKLESELDNGQMSLNLETPDALQSSSGNAQAPSKD